MDIEPVRAPPVHREVSSHPTKAKTSTMYIAFPLHGNTLNSRTKAGLKQESPGLMASWAISRTCRHPQIPGSGVAPSAHDTHPAQVDALYPKP